MEKFKINNEKYLFELQKFLDIASNVKDNELKERIICQMLKCDEMMTKICNEKLKRE